MHRETLDREFKERRGSNFRLGYDETFVIIMARGNDNHTVIFYEGQK